MRVFAVAAVLLLSSSLVPAFAEEAGKAAGSTQPQTVPVQPERSPQQSDQSREEDRRRSEDRQIGSEGQARPSDRDSMGHMDQKDMSRMMERDAIWTGTTALCECAQRMTARTEIATAGIITTRIGLGCDG
jgi:hypothetical protein